MDGILYMFKNMMQVDHIKSMSSPVNVFKWATLDLEIVDLLHLLRRFTINIIADDSPSSLSCRVHDTPHATTVVQQLALSVEVFFDLLQIEIMGMCDGLWFDL